MNRKRIQFLKTVLIGNLRDLQLSAGKTFLEMKTDEKTFPDPVDRATAELTRSVDLLIRGRDRHVIKEIEEALDRIERGDFGICQECGGIISEKRLLAEPTSLLCIECKEKEEAVGRGRHHRRVASLHL